jgi:1,4-dihydroxy-2-naphthoate octaprenyltransferase
MEFVILFIRLTRPLFLLGAILLYTLGAGIAHYLGTIFNWGLFWMGLVWVLLLQLSAHYLNEYYDAPFDQGNENRTPFSGGSGALGPGRLPRRVAIIAALTTLTFLASLTVLILAQWQIPVLSTFIMGLAFLGAFFYSVPPVALERSGYGELTTSFLVAFLLPGYAFSLQTGEFHRLVAMTGFPLVTLHLAMMVSFEFPDYFNDVKNGKQTLLVRLGWQNGILLHNILVLTAFFLVGLALSFKMPVFAALPAFLPLPLALLQIWQYRRISAGSKPNWTALTLNGLALFAAMAYLFAYSFWTH